MGGGSCQHTVLCSCRNASEIIDHVKTKIERCIQKYMSLEETAKYLQEHHQINHLLTKPIWEQLQKDCPDFFKNYYLRCEIGRQTKEFNDLFAKQVAMMLEQGAIDICDGSPPIRNFLSHHPEGIRMMENLAIPPSYKKTKTNFPSLSLPDTNGPPVMQLQIPNNDHHTQLFTPNGLSYYYPRAPPVAPAATNHWFRPNDLECLGAPPTVAPTATNQWSTPTDLACLGAPPTVAPAATYQWSTTPNDLAYNLGAPNFTPAATSGQWSTSNELACFGVPTVAQAATALQDLSIFEFGGDIGDDNLSVLKHMDIDALRQLVMLSENQLQNLNGQYQPQLQQQTLQYGGSNGLQDGGSNGLQDGGSNGMQNGGSDGLQYGGSNGLQYGGSIDNQLYDNYTTQSMRLVDISFEQQQAREVIPQHHHHYPEEHETGTIQLQGQPWKESPESVVLSNPDSGDGALTTAQISIISKGKSNYEFSERNEQYQSEATKEICKK